MFTESQLFDIFGYYEKDRFRHIVDGCYDVRCSHPKPTDFNIQRDLNYRLAHAFSHKATETTVILRRYVLDNGKSGWVGQCDTCGKVYYK